MVIRRLGGAVAAASLAVMRRKPASIILDTSAKRSPFAVGMTPSPRRSNSLVDSVRSSLCNCSLSEGCVTLAACAAAETRRSRCTMLK